MNTVIAIGDFDGVHLGHQAILQTLTGWAADLSADPIVLSFDRNTKGCRVITDEAVKAYYLRKFGVTHWQTLPFAEWREVSAEEFIDKFLKKELHAVGLVCGADFRFGKDRAGNEFTLISRGIAVRKPELCRFENLRISSSLIRQDLEQGDLERAGARLGHPFCLMGKVCHGKGLARQYGQPTVNLPIAPQQLLPPFGVYAAWVEADGKRLPAVANIGVRPTVEEGGAPNLEAHILNHAPDLYDQKLRVELMSFVRPERHFENKDALFAQIKRDGEESLSRLENLA